MLVAGSEATEGRLGRSFGGESSGVVWVVVWESADGGVVNEFVEELSTRSVRESFFMFRRDRGFVVDGRK